MTYPLALTLAADLATRVNASIAAGRAVAYSDIGSATTIRIRSAFADGGDIRFTTTEGAHQWFRVHPDMSQRKFGLHVWTPGKFGMPADEPALADVENS
jgi:hypothetical protein